MNKRLLKNEPCFCVKTKDNKFVYIYEGFSDEATWLEEYDDLSDYLTIIIERLKQRNLYRN